MDDEKDRHMPKVDEIIDDEDEFISEDEDSMEDNGDTGEIKETVNDINTKELSSDDIDDSMIPLDLNNFTPDSHTNNSTTSISTTDLASSQNEKADLVADQESEGNTELENLIEIDMANTPDILDDQPFRWC